MPGCLYKEGLSCNLTTTEDIGHLQILKILVAAEPTRDACSKILKSVTEYQRSNRRLRNAELLNLVLSMKKLKEVCHDHAIQMSYAKE